MYSVVEFAADCRQFHCTLFENLLTKNAANTCSFSTFEILLTKKVANMYLKKSGLKY